MWRVVLCCHACVCAVGCVSSGTWSAYREIERELAEERAAPPPRRSGEAATCSEIATQIADAFPRVRAGRHRARAALARARSEGALPAPELMLEVWDLPVGDLELADREGMYMAGVAQAFPPAGALEGRARAAVERAEEALAEVSDAERTIRARALEACVEWSASHLEIARYREAEAIAERMREAVSARVPSAAASISELARVDAELARVRRMRVESEVRASRAAAWLRARLGGDVPATPPSIEPPPPVDGLEAQVSRALERRGTLRAARARARAAASMADAAQAEASVPTFMVEATYMQMPSARPGVGAAIGMTLPWLWSGEGAARDAARAEEDAALEEVAALELEVRAEVGEAAASVESLRRALDELRERERPAAERALEAVTAGLSTGAVDVTAWLDAARALRELEVDEAGLLRELAIAWIELESASGAREGAE